MRPGCVATPCAPSFSAGPLQGRLKSEEPKAGAASPPAAALAKVMPSSRQLPPHVREKSAMGRTMTSVWREDKATSAAFPATAREPLQRTERERYVGGTAAMFC